MDTLQDFLDYKLLGIEVYVYIVAFLSITAGFVCRRLTRPILARVGRLTSRSQMAYDDIVLEALVPPVRTGFVVAGIWFAILVMPLPAEVIDIERFVFAMLRGTSTVLVLWFGIRLTNGLTDHWMALAETSETKLDDQIIPIFRSSTKVFLVIVGLILVLQNLGYSVGSLIAGVGIGGAAVAFASKDTLSNLFGSLVIFLDRPFQIGDWIQVNNNEGIVEEVGLRTTRIRTFAHSQVTIPNAIFTTTNIENWSRMEKRRIRFTVGLTYSANRAQIEAAVAAIQALVDSHDGFHEGGVVQFTAMGASSLDILVNAYTKTTAYGEFMTIQQAFLLDIMAELEKIGVELAFPTQTLHIGSMPGASASKVGGLQLPT